MTDFLIPIAYSAVAGSATILGLLLVLFAKKFVKKYSFAIVSLAAGVLLGTAFFHLLPEATEIVGDEVYLWVLAGFVLFYIIEALVGFHACKEGEDDHMHILGPVASVGIFFHSILDGIAIAIGFEIDPHLGLVTALAVMVHELPEGIFTLSILLHNKMKLKKAVLLTIAVALATPVGAAVTLLLAPDLGESALGILLAIAGGSFLYIAASDLIPESHKSRSLATGSLMIVGLFLMYILNGSALA
jgi:ZIP family zinc transporter/zinc and cadmium transporter